MGFREFRGTERLQNGLVVLVHENDDPLARVSVEGRDEVGEAFRPRVVATLDWNVPLDLVELRHQVRMNAAGLGEAAVGEVEPHHRMADRPVPPVVDVETPEQLLASLEELLDRVHEEALAETPGTRQEVARTSLVEAPDPGGLVHVVAAFLPEGAEGLNPDRELASHGLAPVTPREGPEKSVTGRPSSPARNAGGGSDFGADRGRVFDPAFHRGEYIPVAGPTVGREHRRRRFPTRPRCARPAEPQQCREIAL